MSDNGHELSRREVVQKIGEVQARLYERRASAKTHAAMVGQRLKKTLTSPATLIGAAGVGFAIAWFYPRRKGPEPEREPGQVLGGKDSTSVMSALMSGLNLAGMVISMFPATAGASAETTDPR